MMSMNISPPRATAERKVDDREGDEADHGAGEQGQDAGAAPADRMPAGGPDAVGDRDHDEHEPEGEGQVPRPVDARTARGAQLAQGDVGPDGAEQPDGHRDEEDQAPVDRSEDAAEDQADEHAADPDDVVDPQRHPALVGGKGVGDDRRRVGQQAGAADALHDPEDDQEGRAGAALHPVDGQQQRGHRVDDEAEVVDLHPADHVAQPAEADDQHARDHEVAEDHPQQVERVRGDQRIEVDAPEDVGHRDDRDRGVERRQQHGQRRVGERHPLVAIGGDRRHSDVIYRLPVQFA
jgi:hypothetical protein